MEWNVVFNVMVWYGVYVFFVFFVSFRFCPLCFLHSPGHLRKKKRNKQQNNMKQKSENTAKTSNHISMYRICFLIFYFAFSKPIVQTVVCLFLH